MSRLVIELCQLGPIPYPDTLPMSGRRLFGVALHLANQILLRVETEEDRSMFVTD